ncbi:MAG: hypothetical protein K5778_03865 [Bacteroidaceae bacterium]|nr:hypothetical protein [Bacteroidaceae bacterium]
MNSKRTMLAWSLLLLSLVTYAQNQEDMNIQKTSYDKSWAKIDAYVYDDLPKSAIKEAEKLYKRAAGERNFAQMTKAGLTLMAMRGNISPDSMVIDVEQLETRIREREASALTARDWAEVALLHALAASVYDTWDYTSLTLSDEETQNMSDTRKRSHVEAATTHAQEIAGVSVKDCRPLMEEAGKDSRFYNDDALSLIVDFFTDSKMMDKEERWQLLKVAAEAYKAKGMREAYALMHMRELDEQNGLDSYRLRLRDDDHEEALRQMTEEFGDTEVGADVYREWMSERSHTTWQEELEMVREAQRRWPKSDIKDWFRRREMECLNPSLSVYVKSQSGTGCEIAGKPLMVQVSHRNIGEADIIIKRLRPDGKLKDRLLCNERMTEMKEGETVWTQHLSFDAHKAHPELAEEYLRDTLSMTLPAGCFRIYVKGGGKESSANFQLTSVQIMPISLPGGRRLVTVVEALTGKPIAGCNVLGTWTKYEDSKWKTYTEEYTTDANGQAVLGKDVEKVAARLTKDDESMEVGVAHEYYHHPSESREQVNYKAFTDRAIYRPGQTVYVSGFVYTRLDEKFRAVPDKEIDILLKDANHQVVQKTTVKTDAFGTASTDFVLPTDRLNGRWEIVFGNGYANFRVEEYKRPTFTVEMEDTPGQFALGDTIEVTGVAKTYSGVPVQNAKVAFTVSQSKSSSWYYWYGGNTWKQVETGETVTDEEGRFRVKVFLDDDLVRNSSDMDADVRKVNGRYVVYDFYGMMHYKVEAKVTDLAGETHENEKSVRVTSRDFSLNITASDLIDRDGDEKPEMKVSAVNAQGQQVPASGTWTLRKFNQQTKLYDVDVATGNFSTDKPVTLPSMAGYELGNYQLEVAATDSREHNIKDRSEFVLWGSKRGGKMNLANDWIHTSGKTLEPGKSIDVWYAVQNPDAHTFLYIMNNANVVVEKIAILDNSQQHQVINYKEEYGEGMRFILLYVMDGQKHEFDERFELKRPEKHLKMAWTTFRDKLTPGQKETWTLRVVDKDGKPVPASVMATMYDASLDYFIRHSWPFSMSFYRDTPSCSYDLSRVGSVSSVGLSFRPDYPDVYRRAYNELRPYSDYDGDYGFISSLRRRSNMLGAAAGRPLLMESRAVMRKDMADGVADQAVEEEMADPAMTSAAGEEEPEEKAEEPKNGIRENFNETAFFFPALQTGKDGSVSMTFTLPDCLTEWRVMSLAHTAGIDYGHLEGTVVARKEFMVQPNMPRFVRQNDRMSIATKIINTSDKDLSGEALIRLINPEDDQEVMTLTKPFAVKAGNTSAVTFDYDVPEQYPMLICEISGKADGFSDGERNFLPVLSSKKYVTETVPFYLEDPSTKTIDLGTLFNNHSATATMRRMTFEYTDNPSWQAILALHAVITPDYDDMVSWSASLYANRVAQSIGKRMPRLLELIMRWNAEEGSETTLTSELEKNQELKEILLQESPWMLDAQDETAQRQKLCELFDQNLLNRRITLAKKKLAEKQFSNGGWSWFQGMEPSYYITLSVSEHMATLLNYLRSQGEEDDDVLRMLKKSIKYLDSEELDYYNKWGKKDKKGLPSESTFRYLYLRTLVPEALKTNHSVEAMKKFYLDKTQKRVGALSMYGRANVAVILYDDHRDDYARKFVQSLHEYTVTKPGMGRYYDTDKAAYSWCDYRIPTHIAAMKSFMSCLKKDGENAPDGLCHDDLMQMQMWLLRQKQTQKWDNVLNTLAVADLLLTIDPETTFHEAQLPQVSFAGQPLEISGQTAGIGYSKTPVPDTMINATEVTVTKQTPGISWGCVYGQCLESLDRFQKTEGELRVDRKTYIERNGTWEELAEGEALKIGDKIRIRNIVSSDRDMDFVQVRSQYAACLEPLRNLSGYQWLGGRGCYLAMHDSAADLFFDRFRKGTSTLDLEFYVTRAGRYSLGISTVQCAYTPAFSGHSAGRSLTVEE